jgi:hypothetical protein
MNQHVSPNFSYNFFWGRKVEFPLILKVAKVEREIFSIDLKRENNWKEKNKIIHSKEDSLKREK